MSKDNTIGCIVVILIVIGIFIPPFGRWLLNLVDGLYGIAGTILGLLTLATAIYGVVLLEPVFNLRPIRA